MGVKIKELLTDFKQNITIENLQNKVVAIDAFNMIYQFLSTIQINGQPLKDYHGNVTSHLQGILSRVLHLLEYQIKPIFVFDGEPNPLKMKEIIRRREIRELAEHQLHEAIDSNNENDIMKFAKGTSKLNIQMIMDAKRLLMAMGIPIINAPQDGEAQVSYMIQQNKAWGCVSQDYDTFLFGAPRIIRNLSASQTRKVNGVTKKIDLEYYSLPKIMEGLQLTQIQLIDIGILIGVDFFKGINGIGVKTAYKMIKEHGSIEKVIPNYPRFDFSILTSEFLDQIRSIFLHPTITDNYSIKFQKPNYDELTTFLIDERNFDRTRIENSLEKLKKLTSQQKQTNFNQFLKK